MRLYDFGTEMSDDGEKIVAVSGRIADQRDPAKQTAHITFRFAVDLPTIRNGAILRKEALNTMHETLFQLAKDFERFGFRPG